MAHASWASDALLACLCKNHNNNQFTSILCTHPPLRMHVHKIVMPQLTQAWENKVVHAWKKHDLDVHPRHIPEFHTQMLKIWRDGGSDMWENASPTTLAQMYHKFDASRQNNQTIAAYLLKVIYAMDSDNHHVCTGGCFAAQRIVQLCMDQQCHINVDLETSGIDPTTTAEAVFVGDDLYSMDLEDSIKQILFEAKNATNMHKEYRKRLMKGEDVEDLEKALRSAMKRRRFVEHISGK